MSNRDTKIIYNGITIHDVLTNQIDYDLVLDNTQTDPLYVLVTVSCSGVVHLQGSAGSSEFGLHLGAYGSGIPSGMAEITDNLMAPRREFEMTMGTQVMFHVYPGYERPGIPESSMSRSKRVESVDCNNGPLPKARITQVVSATTARIEFQIKLHLPYADRPGQTRGGIISFRFWIGEDINCDDWTTERIYHGQLRARHLGYNVYQEFLNNVRCPVLQSGFVCRRISLDQSQNGLELNFTIRDQEVWAVPPYPASSWRGYHSVTSPSPGGATLESELNVTLKGTKDVPKRALLKLAHDIIHKRLHLLDVVNRGATFLQYMNSREALGDNEVEVVARMLYKTDKVHTVWDPDFETFCLPLDTGAYALPGYSKERLTIKKATATLSGLFLAWLNDPLHVATWPSQTFQSPRLDRGERNTNLPKPDQTLVTFPSVDTQYDDIEQQKGAYNLYRMSSDVEIDRGVLQLPFSVASTGTNATDATCVIIPMHNGVARRIVTIDAERINTWPTLPKPEEFTGAGDIIHYPLHDKHYPSAPQLSADGVKSLKREVYRLVFGLSRVPDCTKGEIPAGRLPYRIGQNTQGEPSVYFVPATAYVSPKGILYS